MRAETYRTALSRGKKSHRKNIWQAGTPGRETPTGFIFERPNPSPPKTKPYVIPRDSASAATAKRSGEKNQRWR